MIAHNLLDELQFNDIKESSNLIKKMIEDSANYLETSHLFIFDVFLSLYKYSPHLETRGTINDLLLKKLLISSQFSRLRLRTVGSAFFSYLSLKLLVDNLLLSFRGFDNLKKLQDEKDLALKTITMALNHQMSDDLSNAVKELLEFMDFETPNKSKNELIELILESLKQDSVNENEDTPNQASELIKYLEEKLKAKEEDQAGLDEDPEEGKENSQEMGLSTFLNDQSIYEKDHEQQNPFEMPSDKEDQQVFHYDKVQNQETIFESYHKITDTNHKVRGSQKQSRLSDLLVDLSYINEKINQSIDRINPDKILTPLLDKLDQVRSEVKLLGIDKRSLDTLSFDDVIKIYKRFKDPNFIQFVNKVGKKKSFARHVQRQKKDHDLPYDKVINGHNIDHIIDDELINLALGIEAFDNDFYDRYLNDNLLTLAFISEHDKRKGPIILCYDGSGSMEGKKIKETQSHILAIMEVAKIQKRKLLLIQFASKSEALYVKEINPLYITAQDVFDVLDNFICGGTDFEKPLRKAMEYLLQAQHKKSDILFITDGQCEISPSFKKIFRQTKKRRQFKLYTIIMHAYTYHDYGDIGDISDEVLEIKGQDVYNWNETTNKQLYTLI